ncbi:MAG TPA: helix-turn-helix transcriptional regulator, partial [Bacillota bacterium]|nr:helix-turn-helix transcriptional regulator [Bacillota bacterium]
TLTPSEMEIFKLAEQGYKRAEIGERLFKSENTIKKQIKLILQKLNASDIKEAVRKVNQKGIVEKDDPGAN